jgi:hypothetical protein
MGHVAVLLNDIPYLIRFDTKDRLLLWDFHVLTPIDLYARHQSQSRLLERERERE